jgi:hypothetical protein
LADGGLVPRPFVALIVQLYVLPWFNAVTVIGLAVPVLFLLAPPFDEEQVAV